VFAFLVLDAERASPIRVFTRLVDAIRKGS